MEKNWGDTPSATLKKKIWIGLIAVKIHKYHKLSKHSSYN